MKKRISKPGFNIETVSLHLKRHLIFYVLVSVLFVLLFQNPFSGKNNISNLGPFPDSTLYLNTAKNISLGHGIKINYQESTLDSTIPPLYSITLAPLYTLFKDPRAFYLTNALFTIISAIFFYKILLKLFQNKLLITTLFLAFVTNHVIFYYPTVAMPETLLICLYIISIYLFISPVTIRSSIILGFLTTSFIATKYNAWTISFSLFASYTLFLIYRRNEIPALKHFFYYFLSLLVSALFLIALETFSKTGDLSTQLMYYLRYFDSFSNLIFTPQSTPSITNTPEPITFSPSYISNHLFRYFSGLIGGLSSAAGKDLQTIPIIIGIVSTMAVFVNLFTPKFRFISIYLFITFISTLIFISSFFIYDGRYAFALIPIQILVFGLFLNRILDFLSTKKLTTSYWIVLLTCLFGIIINNFQPVQDQILSNLNPDNSMGAYSSVIFYNQNFKQDTPENKPMIISTLPAPFADFYANQNYKLVPLSNFQYFYGKPELWIKIKNGDDLFDTYESLLLQGQKLYLSNYLTDSLYYSITLDLYKERFELIPVSSGCNNRCQLFRLKIKESF